MLPRNQRMELLSKAYVRAVAAHAGCSCDEVASDFGVDISIRRFEETEGNWYDVGSFLDLQLKSTTTAGIRVTADVIHYDLAVRNYNHLRMVTTGRAAALLVLFVMPEAEAEWLTQNPDGITMRHCCYYLSLTGFPETKNERRVMVSIPQANVFSVAYLQQLQHERRGP
jgi:Domain of unknown function (DUF4365)